MDMKIAWTRLQCQRLATGRFTRPEDVVGWLGAVQAQEYHLAKWGLALRTRRATDATVERAFAAGKILRTHVMRPTWHFVTPTDIRWLLALTAPRVQAVLARSDRTLGITPRIIGRANRAIAAALVGGAALTRAELKAVLAGAGVPVEGTQRLAHIMAHAELDAVICSGPRRGKQFTYALLDHRAPSTRPLAREKALAELARRYFTSHGPAELKDFVWWSGLTSADARAAVERCRRDLVEEKSDGRRYWLASSARTLRRPRRAACLLPPYDEYLIGYRDRSAGRDPFAAQILLDGRVVGAWSRTADARSVTVTLQLHERLCRSDALLVDEAARRYAEFLGLEPAVIRGE
jgi:DNA glycosylase AlkZ-like